MAYTDTKSLLRVASWLALRRVIRAQREYWDEGELQPLLDAMDGIKPPMLTAGKPFEVGEDDDE